MIPQTRLERILKYLYHMIQKLDFSELQNNNRGIDFLIDNFICRE
jgi:hypothetical protein